jgi:hypothetical protein
MVQFMVERHLVEHMVHLFRLEQLVFRENFNCDELRNIFLCLGLAEINASTRIWRGLVIGADCSGSSIALSRSSECVPVS